MTKKLEIEGKFTLVCDLVRKGETISKALKSLDICSRLFCLYITKEQKLEQKQIDLQYQLINLFPGSEKQLALATQIANIQAEIKKLENQVK